MAEEERRMPAGMAGIATYTDVNPEKIRLKPEHVIMLAAVVVATEVLLHVLRPVGV